MYSEVPGSKRMRAFSGIISPTVTAFPSTTTSTAIAPRVAPTFRASAPTPYLWVAWARSIRTSSGPTDPLWTESLDDDGAAVAGHPDALPLDTTIQLTAAPVLL